MTLLCSILASEFASGSERQNCRSRRVKETKGDRERRWLRVGWAGSEEESIHNETKMDKTHKKRGETSPSQ